MFYSKNSEEGLLLISDLQKSCCFLSIEDPKSYSCHTSTEEGLPSIEDLKDRFFLIFFKILDSLKIILLDTRFFDQNDCQDLTWYFWSWNLLRNSMKFFLYFNILEILKKYFWKYSRRDVGTCIRRRQWGGPNRRSSFVVDIKILFHFLFLYCIFYP